jgi:hypothetical protein
MKSDPLGTYRIYNKTRVKFEDEDDTGKTNDNK